MKAKLRSPLTLTHTSSKRPNLGGVPREDAILWKKRGWNPDETNPFSPTPATRIPFAATRHSPGIDSSPVPFLLLGILSSEVETTVSEERYESPEHHNLPKGRTTVRRNARVAKESASFGLILSYYEYVNIFYSTLSLGHWIKLFLSRGSRSSAYVHTYQSGQSTTDLSIHSCPFVRLIVGHESRDTLSKTRPNNAGGVYRWTLTRCVLTGTSVCTHQGQGWISYDHQRASGCLGSGDQTNRLPIALPIIGPIGTRPFNMVHSLGSLESCVRTT